MKHLYDIMEYSSFLIKIVKKLLNIFVVFTDMCD